jgi:hypothetical protein
VLLLRHEQVDWDELRREVEKRGLTLRLKAALDYLGSRLDAPIPPFKASRVPLLDRCYAWTKEGSIRPQVRVLRPFIEYLRQRRWHKIRFLRFLLDRWDLPGLVQLPGELWFRLRHPYQGPIPSRPGHPALLPKRRTAEELLLLSPPAYFHGLTMPPFLREGDRVTVEPVDWRDLRPGDIITYRFEDKYPTRRVIRVDRRTQRIITKGDSIKGRREYPTTAGDVLGRACRRQRQGTAITTDHWEWRLAAYRALLWDWLACVAVARLRRAWRWLRA